MHAKFHEFSMHRDADMNLSLFFLKKNCILEEQEFRRFNYIKDVVLDEVITTKLNS
jgi:hypothetical protein